MEKKVENKLIMLKAVLSLLNQNQSIWQEVAPLSNTIQTLSSKVAEIEDIRQITSVSQTGMITAKQNLQSGLIEQTFALASILTAYAAQTNDPVLQAKVDFPISELRSLRDSELAPTCRNVLNLGLAREAALGPYGVTANQLNNLTAAITTYEQQLPTHRVSVAERKAANEKLKDVMAETMVLVTEQLDRLVIAFKATRPDVYAAYLNARKVVDYWTRYGKETPDTSPATV